MGDRHNSQLLVCQMLSWWTKNWRLPINIWDIVTNAVPLCSVYQAPSYEPSHTYVASLVSANVCWHALLAVQAIWRINYSRYSNKPTIWKMVLGKWDLANMMVPRYTECNGNLLSQYLRYWWNEVNFASARITFDGVYIVYLHNTHDYLHAHATHDYAITQYALHTNHTLNSNSFLDYFFKPPFFMLIIRLPTHQATKMLIQKAYMLKFWHIHTQFNKRNSCISSGWVPINLIHSFHDSVSHSTRKSSLSNVILINKKWSLARKFISYHARIQSHQQPNLSVAWILPKRAFFEVEN